MPAAICNPRIGFWLSTLSPMRHMSSKRQDDGREGGYWLTRLPDCPSRGVPHYFSVTRSFRCQFLQFQTKDLLGRNSVSI